MPDLADFPIAGRWPAKHPSRLQLYSLPTPNGVKVSIALEEIGLPYEAHAIDIGKNESWTPEFLALNPNGKIPAIIDPDGPGGKPMPLAESGAILFYLASKTGRFLPEDLRKRWQVMQWVMFQMGHIGPMLGQAHHFLGYAPEKIEYAMNRYKNEANRLYGVLERRLGESKYVACEEYTIAEMATMPWLRFPERQGVNIEEYPKVKRWRDGIAARPAAQRAAQELGGLDLLVNAASDGFEPRPVVEVSEADWDAALDSTAKGTFFVTQAAVPHLRASSLGLVVVIEDVGAYKPAENHFRALDATLADLGVDRGALLHVAQSLFHDHVPAKREGLPSVWINRRHDRPGWGATPQPSEEWAFDLELPSMAAFADAVDEAFR